MVDIWVLGVGVLKFGISAKKGFRLMWSILFCVIVFLGVHLLDGHLAPAVLHLLARRFEQRFDVRTGF